MSTGFQEAIPFWHFFFTYCTLYPVYLKLHFDPENPESFVCMGRECIHTYPVNLRNFVGVGTDRLRRLRWCSDAISGCHSARAEAETQETFDWKTNENFVLPPILISYFKLFPFQVLRRVQGSLITFVVSSRMFLRSMYTTAKERWPSKRKVTIIWY